MDILKLLNFHYCQYSIWSKLKKQHYHVIKLIQNSQNYLKNLSHYQQQYHIWTRR